MSRDVVFATENQKSYIKDMCTQLGYDFNEYLKVDLTLSDASLLIKELRDELG